MEAICVNNLWAIYHDKKRGYLLPSGGFTETPGKPSVPQLFESKEKAGRAASNMEGVHVVRVIISAPFFGDDFAYQKNKNIP
ncbi:hypothetical protein HFU84_08510 [Acidithiobacillus sp. CV18-2]|nr:hypothetical protein [Acidithiobacillus sp. CV18-3]MBU2756933.1 hypothetical protein [Acidithiobacillus sp. BN09-2]MBU2777544.1 hypothetical protein [Acidithiobacillus sp. CV18-2]MBU2799644.1 hypothetical protein [Acidithiobacillus sp. VAN18-4]